MFKLFGSSSDEPKINHKCSKCGFRKRFLEENKGRVSLTYRESKYIRGEINRKIQEFHASNGRYPQKMLVSTEDVSQWISLFYIERSTSRFYFEYFDKEGRGVEVFVEEGHIMPEQKPISIPVNVRLV